MKDEIVGFEHIHLHTSTGSLLDGFGNVEDYAKKWKGPDGGDFFCISDHGMMAAIPAQIRACAPSNKKDDPNKNKKLFSIFASELYINPLQIEYSSDAELKQYMTSLNEVELKQFRHRGYHLLAIAFNQKGYSNLVKLSSLGWTKGFYYKPRVNHEQLKKYKEGIIFTSCCYASEIAQAFDKGGEEAGFAMIEKYHAMFGENFYLEIMLLDFPKQRPYNNFIIKAHLKYGIPIEISCDTHYVDEKDSYFQRLMLMAQTKSTIKTIQQKLEQQGITDLFELQDTNLWMKIERELNQKYWKDFSSDIDYEIFKKAKQTTVEICRKAKGVEIDRTLKLPQLPDANEKLKELMLKGFKEKGLPRTKKYLDRIKEEYELICHKDFASYFLIQKMMVDEARRICPEFGIDEQYAVSCGRGSCCGSLMYFLLDITGIDSVKEGLLFSRFLSASRGGKTLSLRFAEEPL